MLFFKKPPLSWPGAAYTLLQLSPLPGLGRGRRAGASRDILGAGSSCWDTGLFSALRGPLTGWRRRGGTREGPDTEQGTQTFRGCVSSNSVSKSPLCPSVLCGLGRTGFDSPCLKPKYRTHLASLGKPCVISCWGMNGFPSIYVLRS